MDDILLNTEVKMEEAVSAMEKRFNNVRAGRANPAILDAVMVNYYGVDTPSKEELISAKMSNEEVCEFIQADSLSFLSLEGLKRSIGIENYQFCQACFDGNYIVK